MAVALMMVFLLTRAGCEAQTALNAEKALRLAQAEMFDLITLDVEMPGLNGFELFQALEANPPLGRNADRICIRAVPQLKISSAPLTLGRRISLRSHLTRKISSPAFFHSSKKPQQHEIYGKARQRFGSERTK